MARVKHVLPMRDVFAHWIAQDQDSARMSNPESWHFEGDTMYEGRMPRGRLFKGNQYTYVFGHFPWRVSGEFENPTVEFEFGYYSRGELESIGYLMWSKIRNTIKIIRFPLLWHDTEYMSINIKNMVASIYRAIDIGRRAVEDGILEWTDYKIDNTMNVYIYAMKECIVNSKIDIRGVWRRILSKSEYYRNIEECYIEKMTQSEYDKAWVDALEPYREDVGSHEYYNVWSTML